MNIPEILPCPFCDKPADPIAPGHWGCSDRECAAYMANIPLDKWNRRQPTPEAADNETVKQLVDKFLAWPLPESVCPDLCTNVTREQYPHPRIGTMLLTAIEAELMIRYLGLYPCPCHPAVKQGVRSHEVELRCSHLNGCNNIMDELKEHTHAAQGEDAYLRIYPCDARKILEAAHPPKPEPTEAAADTADSAARQLSWRFKVRRSNDEIVPIEEIAAVVRAYIQRDAPKPPEEWMEEAASEILAKYLAMFRMEDAIVRDSLTAIIARHYTAPAEG